MSAQTNNDDDSIELLTSDTSFKELVVKVVRYNKSDNYY